MKISLSWLGDHVDLSGLAPDEVAHQLTMKTALIEAIERPGDDIADVIVAHVVECGRHPDADRLSVCKVDSGDGEPVDVVCGAPNVAAGQKIAFAPVGSVLPGGLKLTKRKLRGVQSNGMVCSEQELGLSDSHDGIMVLDEDASLGTKLIDHLQLADVVFDIDNASLTHRADLWSHRGFARELAAIFDRPMKELRADATLKFGDTDVSIQLDDLEGCPQYLALRMRGVPSNAPAPGWIRQRLLAVGLRPIHLLVDLSNYVMLDVGQPTHAFDARKLGSSIVVRRARDGEKIETLDDVDRKLHAEDLVIADAERAVAIAGVMGGAATEVGGDTTELILESASFDPVITRRSAGRAGLRTDASTRFEKGLDHTLPEIAVRRYAHLLRKVCDSAEIDPTIERAGEPHIATPQVALRPSRAVQKLGFEVTAEEMTRALDTIGFAVVADGEILNVTVPAWRSGRDISCEDDLIEEVGRLAGYDRAPSELPKLSISPPSRDPLRLLERDTVMTLVRECGYAEVAHYSFATDRHVELHHGPDERFVEVANPLTADTTRLRRSLVPGVLGMAQGNVVRTPEFRLVECGRTYLVEGEKDGLPQERRWVVGVTVDKLRDPEEVLLEARSDVDLLLRSLGRSWQGQVPETAPRFAHPGRCIALRAGTGGKVFGHLAQLHPQLAQAEKLPAATIVLELDLEAICSVPAEVTRMQPIPQYPATLRDLSVEVPDTILVAKVVAEIRKGGGPKVDAVELFDVYRGEGIADGHRSLAFRIDYRADDRTLTDDEVDKLHQKIVKRLTNQGMRQR